MKRDRRDMMSTDTNSQLAIQAGGIETFSAGTRDSCGWWCSASSLLLVSNLIRCTYIGSEFALNKMHRKKSENVSELELHFSATNDKNRLIK